jgi:Mrp family chromosome partitioning ATPase
VLDKLLGEAEKDYDLIIVDAPPLLGFAEPLQMAAVVDGIVVITMAGQTNRKALESVITSLKRIKTNVVGVVLNEVREDMSDRYYNYGYYGKYYSKYYKPTSDYPVASASLNRLWLRSLAPRICSYSVDLRVVPRPRRVWKAAAGVSRRLCRKTNSSR